MNFTLRELLFGVIASGALVGAIVQGFYLETNLSQKHEMRLQVEKRELEQDKERMQRYYQFKLKEAGILYKPEDDDPKKKASWNELLPGYDNWGNTAVYIGYNNIATTGSGNVFIGWPAGMVINYPLGRPFDD